MLEIIIDNITYVSEVSEHREIGCFKAGCIAAYKFELCPKLNRFCNDDHIFKRKDNVK